MTNLDFDIHGACSRIFTLKAFLGFDFRDFPLWPICCLGEDDHFLLMTTVC